MELDYLVLAAHPDDAELFCSGTLIKMREKGYKVGILDFTKGEAATSGTVEDREKETDVANQILQPAFRENLQLPDSRLVDDHDTRVLVVDVIREYRVKILIAPLGPCRHPDHTVVSQLAKNVHFFSGAGKFPSRFAPWRPARVIYHLEYQDRTPSFVIDISDQFASRMKAVEAYSTQFYSAANKEEKTVIGSQRFLQMMTSRFSYYGSLINCEYGEPFFVEEMLRLDDPIENLNW